MRNRQLTCLLVLVVSVLSGCTSLAGSALEAAKEPQTWAPLIGAVVLAATDLDKDIAEDARRERSLFRDPQGSSDDLRDLLAISYGASALFVPREDGQTRLGALAANVGGYAASNISVGVLKDTTNRRRPEGGSKTSFPSGHAANASYLASATRFNLEGLSWPSWSLGILNAGLQGAAVGVAWGRIEAGKHYPSDVLAGYALGHFLAALVDNALGERTRRLQIKTRPVPRGAVVELQVVLD